MQGLLEVLDVPYAGSDVEASAICMDKLVFKDLLGRHGVPQVDYCRAGEEGWRELAAGFGQPVWVKPARLGSSVGIAPASGEEELDARGRGGAPARPARDRRGARPGQGGRVLAARQRGAGRLAARARSSPRADWYDYEAKYAEGGMELVVPAEISDERHGAAAGARRPRVHALRLQRPRAL